MAANEEMLQIAKKVRPNYVTLVPEKREEVTTEGGLDINADREFYAKFVEDLKNSSILVSAFIDPDISQIQSSQEVGCEIIELHTGGYAVSKDQEQKNELMRIKEATIFCFRSEFNC